ncbi:MAG: hypothetical protein NVS2B12_17680 [Ktedonobacteraceae bacterium]
MSRISHLNAVKLADLAWTENSRTNGVYCSVKPGTSRADLDLCREPDAHMCNLAGWQNNHSHGLIAALIWKNIFIENHP